MPRVRVSKCRVCSVMERLRVLRSLERQKKILPSEFKLLRPLIQDYFAVVARSRGYSLPWIALHIYHHTVRRRPKTAKVGTDKQGLWNIAAKRLNAISEVIPKALCKFHRIRKLGLEQLRSMRRSDPEWRELAESLGVDPETWKGFKDRTDR